MTRFQLDDREILRQASRVVSTEIIGLDAASQLTIPSDKRIVADLVDGGFRKRQITRVVSENRNRIVANAYEAVILRDESMYRTDTFKKRAAAELTAVRESHDMASQKLRDELIASTLGDLCVTTPNHAFVVSIGAALVQETANPALHKQLSCARGTYKEVRRKHLVVVQGILASAHSLFEETVGGDDDDPYYASDFMNIARMAALTPKADLPRDLLARYFLTAANYNLT